MITEIKNHRVRHGNIMDGIDDLMVGNQADFIYSDPPWGQGNLRYWQTMNKKMNNASPVEIDYEKFLPHFFSIISKYAKDKVVIEYGCQWNEDIKNMAKKYGFHHCGSTVCFYKSGSQMRPCDLHFLTKTSSVSLSEEFKQECQKKEDLQLVEYIFNYLEIPKEGICLDPMCGMGFTAQAAVNRGMRFFGNELNLKRLEKTKKRLLK